MKSSLPSFRYRTFAGNSHSGQAPSITLTRDPRRTISRRSMQGRTTLGQDDLIGDNHWLAGPHGLWHADFTGYHATDHRHPVSTTAAGIGSSAGLAGCAAGSHRCWCGHWRRHSTRRGEARRQVAETPLILPNFEREVAFRKALATGEPGGGQHNWHAHEGPATPQRPPHWSVLPKGLADRKRAASQVDRSAPGISERPSNPTPHWERGKKSGEKISSRAGWLPDRSPSPYDAESWPASAASFAHVSAGLFLISSHPLTTASNRISGMFLISPPAGHKPIHTMGVDQVLDCAEN